NRKDQCLRRIDDRAEGFDAVSAEVRDGDCAAGVFLRLEFLAPGTCGEILDGLADLAQRLFLRIADDGRDESFLDSDSDAEMNAAILDNRVAGETRIDRGDALSGTDHGFEDEIVDGEFRTAAGFGHGVEFLTRFHERSG